MTRMPLGRWGITGAQVILVPLAIPLVVYGAAYAIAVDAGFAHRNPGEGRWTTDSQIAANLVINLALTGVIGTLTAMGEEIGWRGYLQPRLDAAGVRSSIVIVWLFQLAVSRAVDGRGRLWPGRRPWHEPRALRHRRSSGLVHHGERVVSCAQPLAGGLLPQLSQHDLAVALSEVLHRHCETSPGSEARWACCR